MVATDFTVSPGAEKSWCAEAITCQQENCAYWKFRGNKQWALGSNVSM